MSVATSLNWQSELFASRHRPAPVYAGVDDQLADARSRLQRLSARAAYQYAIHDRAVIVDTRPIAQRATFGEIHPDLNPLVVERNVLEWRFDPRHDARLDIASFDLRVIVMCQGGYASSIAADSLLRLGITRATDMVGGFESWLEAGLPTA